jgi:DNA-binding transcriptional LysR family regulator
MRFDLTDLRLFLLVVEAGSITHGAAAANLALPSASARLRGMELSAGLPLLERGRRGVVPTPAGDAVARHARIVLRQMEAMRGELGTHSSGLKGRVRLLANTAAMTEFLPEALAPWLARHPGIDLDLRERLSTEIVTAVAGGTVDFGIVSDAVEHGGLERRPFATDRLVLVVPRGHALSGGTGDRCIAFREVLGQPFVGLSAGSALQDYLAGHAARAGQPMAFRVRLPGLEAVCRMVAAGIGVAILPETAARRCGQAMPIDSLRLSDGWATRRLMLCLRRPDSLPLHARALVEHLSAGAGPAVTGA